jgi:hypothetical protein
MWFSSDYIIHYLVNFVRVEVYQPYRILYYHVSLPYVYLERTGILQLELLNVHNYFFTNIYFFLMNKYFFYKKKFNEQIFIYLYNNVVLAMTMSSTLTTIWHIHCFRVVHYVFSPDHYIGIVIANTTLLLLLLCWLLYVDKIYWEVLQ